MDTREALKLLSSIITTLTSPIYDPIRLSREGIDQAQHALMTIEDALGAMDELRRRVKRLEFLEQAHQAEIERIYQDEVEPLRKQAGLAVVLQQEVARLNRVLNLVKVRDDQNDPIIDQIRKAAAQG